MNPTFSFRSLLSNKPVKLLTMRTVKVLFFFMFLIVAILPSAGAEDLHKKGWTDVLNSGGDIAKYAIYGNRILAVMNPEIYLKADIDMLREIMALDNGIKEYYSWDKLEEKKTFSQFARYPENIDLYPFLDRRLLPPTASLKKNWGGETKIQRKLTELEKAIVAYYIKSGDDVDLPLAILYCQDESAYIIEGDNSVSMKNLVESTVTKTKCNPQLVMNETDSWYPIMDKEPKNKYITSLKGFFKKQYSKPDLSAEEESLLSKLKKVTKVPPNETDRLILLAEKRGPLITLDHEFVIDETMLKMWREVFGYSREDETNIHRVHTGASHLIMQDMNRIGNLLSPMSAYIAASTEKCRSKPWKCIEGWYAKYFGWHLLWNWGLTSFSIDESITTGGSGVCSVQATNMASILDLIDIDYYLLHLTGYNEEGRRKDHRIVFVPSWDVTFSNSQLLSGYDEPSDYKGLVYIYHKNGWIFFADDIIFGNGNQQTAAEIVENFLSMTENKNIEDQFICEPFATEGDINSCRKIIEKIKDGNYKRIKMTEEDNLTTALKMIM